MHPLTPYLDGLPHPRGPRLASVQRCLRTTDLEEVGDERHLTVFQMLGTWSLGDYDGPQSLRWGYELITKILGTERGCLHATAFGGDEQVGPDIQAQRTRDDLGVPVELTGRRAAAAATCCGGCFSMRVPEGAGRSRGRPARAGWRSG